MITSIINYTSTNRKRQNTTRIYGEIAIFENNGLTIGGQYNTIQNLYNPISPCGQGLKVHLRYLRFAKTTVMTETEMRPRVRLRRGRDEAMRLRGTDRKVIRSSSDTADG